MSIGRELDAMLDGLTERVGEIRHALVLSDDGLVTGASASLERSDAERLAAVASGLHSLAKGTGRQFRAGRVRQTMVEFDGGVLFVTAAGQDSCLCVLGGADADIGRIGYEMTLLVNRIDGRPEGSRPEDGGPGERAGSYPQA
ncbi:roadblock/LC7 domain-containing protein [Streptomyces triculaminicus]|uniref:Roadblock/LC7 domain-containing protein n=1 Tax=Streptomyces triculaminicus TaxID=2816232 RepID=A0A939JTY1_9ACTN|nr:MULTISPECIES: roadblock/LC7 domain-containing protein [Streptomyces]MBO0656189.1 roadblock/LC7 domain-containing protein [Streptomyces triculaminicus]